MNLEAPPSRYRVVERGGRLVVIDTVAGGTPLKAKELVPAAIDNANEPSFPSPVEDGETHVGTAQEFLLQALASRATRHPSNASLVAEPPGFLRNIATTVCSDKRDGDGRLQWTTARWFDAKGPRTVALTRKGEEQLGLTTLALLIGALCAVIFAVAMGFVGWIILVIAGTTLPKGKPAATAWIDRLGRA